MENKLKDNTVVEEGSVTSSSSKNSFNDDYDDNGTIPLLSDNDHYSISRHGPSEQSQPMTLRSLLLALSLTLTLSVFWLLDSLKDPTFATLVNGNLKRHQPFAKMASVAATLVLAILMEVVSHERKKNARAMEETVRLADDEVQDGGGKWTKMTIGTEYVDNLDNNEEDDERIPISVFRSVGLTFIVIFGSMAYFLSLHPVSGEVVESEPLTKNGDIIWHVLGYFQYIAIESFGSISVATFWSFANSTLTLKAAKRYYGFIIAIAQVGAIGGSTMATIPGVSIPSLFLLACIGIMIQIGIMTLYGRWFPYVMRDEDDDDISLPRKNTTQKEHLNGPIERQDSENSTALPAYMSGVNLILKHNYLLLILGVSCLYEVSLTCLDYEMKLIGLDRFRLPPDMIGELNELENLDALEGFDAKSTAEAFTTFMGRYGQLTNLLSLALSYFAFPYLMDNYGLKHTLRLFPTLLFLITITTFVALPLNLPVLFISMSLLKAMTYSINDPAKEILYIPTTNEIKFKVKFWIDVVGARVAKALGSTINTYAGSAERIVQYGSIPSVVTAVALWVICYSAGLEFDSLLENGKIVGEENNQVEVIDVPRHDVEDAEE